MLREYEVTIIFNSQAGEENAKKLQEKYEGVLLGNSGEIIKKDDWGSRKLSFPIKKNFRGRYVHYDLACESQNVTEAERLMRIDEGVLRYLSICTGKKVDVESRKLELAKIAARRRSENLNNLN